MNDHVVNAGLVVVSVLVVLAGLETALVFGVVEADPYSTRDMDTRKQTCEHTSNHDRPDDQPSFHSKYGWTFSPNVVFHRKVTPAQEWERHAIDDEGFRDVYDSGDQGVVVLGDSFTYGALASGDETYPHLLDRWNPNVSVHNYGMGGYGPQQYYLVYEDKAEAIDHDLVVVGFYRNDPGNTVARYPPVRPLFGVSNGELQQVREPKLENELEDSDPDKLPVEDEFAIVTALLDRINRIAVENDAQVLVVTLPHKREVGAEHSSSRMGQSRRLDRYAAAEDNVHTLHTKPALIEARESRRVFGIYDFHLDDYGYYVIARTIQSWLVENDEETRVDVTADPGDPPPGNILSSVSPKLRSNTESYGFLSRRSRLLVYRARERLGFGDEGNVCE